MDLKGKLKQGMRIFGADDRDYGTVERYDDEYVYVGGRRVPYDAFDRHDNDRLYLGQSGAQYFTDTARTGTTEGQIRVPVHEERLDVDKRQVELGAVGIRKEVESEQVSVPVELTREEVRVQQVDTPNQPVTAGDSELFQEGTIRVPVRGEEAVVSKQAFVTGEVVVDKERQTERQTITDTVRRERVDVDENYARDRSAFEQHFTQRRGQAAGATADTRGFTEAEPNYRMGYEAGYDERYANKDWDDVEPELRRGYKGSDSWEHLREEIREGWRHARGM